MGFVRQVTFNIVMKCKIMHLALRGFTRESLKTYFLLGPQSGAKGGLGPDLPNRELLAMLPFDAKVDALCSDRFSPWFLFPEDRDMLPVPFFLLLMRDGHRFVLPVSMEKQDGGFPFSDDIETTADHVVLRMAKEGGARIVPLDVRSPKRSYCVCHEDGRFSLDGAPITVAELTHFIDGLKEEYLVSELVDGGAFYQVNYSNENVGGPLYLGASRVRGGGEGDLSDWIHLEEYRGIDALVEGAGLDAELIGRLSAMAGKLKSLEFCGFRVAVGADGPKVLQLDAGLDLIYTRAMSLEMERFASAHSAVAKGRVSFRKVKSAFGRVFWRSLAAKRGYVWFMYRNWVRDSARDLLFTRLPLRDKLWAHCHGFLSFRIPQYNIDRENVGQFLSDRDYRYLRPINGSLRKWLEDKISMRYVLEEYSECLPKYYFHLAHRWEGLRAIPLPDCPSGLCCEGYDGVIELLEQKGRLALKPVTGSHGEGFRRLEVAPGGLFAINGASCSRPELKEFLEGLSVDYVVTEYVEMHHELKKIFDAAACTVRLMVINRTGRNAEIVNAYYRIGTSSTGFTDNVGFGGIYAYVDIETGHYCDAEMLVDHVIRPCPTHPDTGVMIEGFMPHWNVMLEGVRRLCNHLSPLEYLGVDVVITEHGFTILEINTHQDLHRYPTYSDGVRAYFDEKLALKRSGKRMA